MARPAALLAALVLACMLAAGCGGDDGGSDSGEAAADNGHHDTRQATSVGPRIAGSVVQYADCQDWRRGTRAERKATVLELRDQLTAQGSRDTASPLPDRRAYRIFQKTCKQDFSQALRLYKLYARAQGYAPLGE